MIIEAVLPLVGSFADQVVLVTGASSGIGRETALLFARRGARVALAARRRDLLDEVAALIRGAGGTALVVPTDVTEKTAAQAAAARVRRAWGRIDVLVNNAGVLKPSLVASLRAADLEAMLRVNLFGALFMTQAVLPAMQRRGGGAIINVASLAGRRGVTPLGGYCATKFALVGLTEALRTEVDAARIHVGVVLARGGGDADGHRPRPDGGAAGVAGGAQHAGRVGGRRGGARRSLPPARGGRPAGCRAAGGDRRAGAGRDRRPDRLGAGGGEAARRRHSPAEPQPWQRRRRSKAARRPPENMKARKVRRPSRPSSDDALAHWTDRGTLRKARLEGVDVSFVVP